MTKPTEAKPLRSPGSRDHPIWFNRKDYNRLLKRSNRNRRPDWQEIMVILDSVEHLEKDIDGPLREQIDPLKGKRTGG